MIRETTFLQVIHFAQYETPQFFQALPLFGYGMNT